MAEEPGTGAIVSVNPSIFRVNKSIMDTLGNVSGVAETSPQLYILTLELPELSSSPVSIFGIDPESDFTIQPWLQQPLGAPLKRGEVIIGQDIDGEVRIADLGEEPFLYCCRKT